MAHHDRAWITFAVNEAPRALIDALPEGGVLLVPVGPPDGTQLLLRFKRENGAIVEKAMAPARYVPARPLIVAQ